jgi:hypothetical protein
LNGTNTFSGGLNANAGSLLLGNSGALGTGRWASAATSRSMAARR